MNEADFYLTVGDTSDPLEAELQNDDGESVDLTGATVRFKMAPIGGDTVSVDAAATIDSATDGHVTYEWGDSDTNTAGYYNARFVVDYSGETGSSFDADQSFPNEGYLVIKIDEGLP